MGSLSETRPNFVDYAKVIAIFCVVLGHYTYALGFSYEPSPIWSVMHIITLFHMPFFFMVSGILYKKTDTKAAISKGWIQLLKPYLIMSVLISAVMLIVETLTDGISVKYVASVIIGIFSANDFPIGTANWSSALWFCYSLFLIKVLYSYLSKRPGGGYYLLSICCTAAVLMYFGNKLPLRIDSSIVGFVFFLMGNRFSGKLSQLQEMSMIKRLIVLVIAAVVLSVSAYFNLKLDQRQGLSINAMYFGPYPPLFLLSGIGGSVLLLCLAAFFESFKNKIVLTISNGTIVILGFHWVVYKLCFSLWLSSYDVTIAIMVAFVNVIICYGLIIFFGKYYPVILGNRKIR